MRIRAGAVRRPFNATVGFPSVEGMNRVRPMSALFAVAALVNAAMAMSSALSTIVMADRLGPGWGGVANAAAIVGTGAGAYALSRLADRRASLRLGCFVGAVGAGVA